MKILTVVKKTGYNFIRHYLPYFPKGSLVVYDAKPALNMIPLFDVVLFEWGNDLTANIINCDRFLRLQKENSFKTIVRVHDHEVTKSYGGIRRIDNIDWGRVDKVWFINPGIHSEFHRLKGDNIKSFFLSNAVDPKTFEEAPKSEKKVGLLSIWFRPRKRIDRVLEIAKLLPDWIFYIRSHVPGRHERFYDEYIKIKAAADKLDNVVIEHRDANRVVRSHYDYHDLKKWYKDKSVILSTSDHEGFHYAVAEAALTGSMPVVFDWPTSDVFWYPYVVKSTQEAAERIKSFTPSSTYRTYITNNFNPEKLVLELEREISQ